MGTAMRTVGPPTRTPATLSDRRCNPSDQVRSNARLKYLVHTLGIDDFRTLTELYFGEKIEPWRPLPPWRYTPALALTPTPTWTLTLPRTLALPLTLTQTLISTLTPSLTPNPTRYLDP